LEANFAGVTLEGSGRLWQLAPPDLNAHNEPGKPMAVNIAESALNQVPTKLEVPPISISIYELRVQ